MPANAGLPEEPPIVTQRYGRPSPGWRRRTFPSCWSSRTLSSPSSSWICAHMSKGQVVYSARPEALKANDETKASLMGIW